MLGCLGPEVTVVVSVVDCVASVVDYEARSMEDAEVMDVAGTVAASRNRICIKITRVRSSRRVGTVEHMMEGILAGTVVVMARGATRQNLVNKSWFAT